MHQRGGGSRLTVSASVLATDYFADRFLADTSRPYWQIQFALNMGSPLSPLIRPPQAFVPTTDLANAVSAAPTTLISRRGFASTVQLGEIAAPAAFAHLPRRETRRP
jgi:hypothetical protein